MRSILFIYISIFLFFNTYAQHAEVNLFEKTSHKKYVEYQVQKFFKTNKIIGFSFIIANKGRVVYSKAQGLSNYENKVPLTLNTPIPIGEATRLFTATAILKLLQEGKVSLEDRVFGPKSLFEKDIPKPPVNVDAITIHNLIDRSVYTGNIYSKMTSDKMLNIKTTTRYLSRKTPNSISRRNNLFSYYILGRVIEQISGQTYEEYLVDMTKDLIKNKIKVTDVIAKKLKKFKNTTIHNYNYPPFGDSIDALQCSTGDLMNFVLSIDGQGAVNDILIPASLKIMQSPHYIIKDRSKAWDIDQEGFYTYSTQEHYTTLVRMRNDGITWTISALGSTGGKAFNDKAEDLLEKILKRVKDLP